METKDHFRLAINFAGKKEYGISTASFLAFVFGNISPDINIFTYIAGHTFEGSSKKIQKLLRMLQKKRKLEVKDYYLLGKAMHYLMDFFTYPHNKTFLGTMKEHCSYEQELHVLFWRKFHEKSNHQISYEEEHKHKDIGDFISNVHQDYLTKRSNIEDDCLYIKRMYEIVFGRFLHAKQIAVQRTCPV